MPRSFEFAFFFFLILLFFHFGVRSFVHGSLLSARALLMYNLVTTLL